MADTFDSIWENKTLSKLKKKVEVLCDFAYMVHNGDTKEPYLFIVKPTQDS